MTASIQPPRPVLKNALPFRIELVKRTITCESIRELRAEANRNGVMIIKITLADDLFKMLGKEIKKGFGKDLTSGSMLYGILIEDGLSTDPLLGYMVEWVHRDVP
jgi:hypothetical protein